MLATATAVAALVAATASGAPNVAPHAPALREARVAPHTLAYVAPGAAVTLANASGYTCPRKLSPHGHRASGYYTDTSAYTWRGGAMGRQHVHTTYSTWQVPRHHGQYVRWDGATVYNDTHAPVLFGGWC